MISLILWLTTPAPAEFPARLEWAIEQTESGGDPWVKRGSHRGLWQVSSRWATPLVRKSPALLYDPEVGRAEGRRHLHGWLKVCDGDMRCALRGYRCGWGGIKAKCGRSYAAKVLRLAAD